MPKRKEFLNSKNKPGKKSRDEAPQSENDYLAAGVDFEEAGEKWRAGDAAKSMRFFIRAIETYDSGLQRFSESFDLAYNKARVQYEIAQQPRMLEHLPISLLDLLQTALDSHRFALRVGQDNPDLLFNTAQVLTSLAEASTELRRAKADVRENALRLLQEALELFQRCLNLQEFKYEEAVQRAAQVAEKHFPDGKVEPKNIGSTGSDVSDEEVWASIEEPVTKDTLFDSAIAQLETLTALCNLGGIQDHNGLAWIEEYYRSTLQFKVNSYAAATTRQQEVGLAKGKYLSATSDAAFRTGRLDLSTYERELAAAFTSPELNLDNDPQALCDRADAELTFSTSVRDFASNGRPEDISLVASTCWKHFTKALDSLTAASKLQDALHLPRIHLRRGDCEMLRLHLGEAPLSNDLAIKSMPTLLKNAEVYYRGACVLAERSKDDVVERNEAEVKEALAAALADDTQKFMTLIKLRQDSVEAIIGEMEEEGSLGEAGLQKLRKICLEVQF